VALPPNDQAPENEMAPVVPGKSIMAHSMLVDEGADRVPLPSEPIHYRDPASVTVDEAEDSEPDLEPKVLDGLWQVVDWQRNASMINVQMFFFIVDGHNITAADMQKSSILEVEGRPNTIVFGDAQGELVSKDIFKLTFADGGACVNYCRMCLPHPSILSELQGEWVQHSRNVAQTDCKLSFEGALVKLSKQAKVTHTALHVRQNDGSMMLCNSAVEIHFCGSLFLRTASGSLQRYVRCMCPVMDAIPEESSCEVSW